MMTMPEPKKVKEIEDESIFEVEEEPIIPEKVDNAAPEEAHDDDEEAIEGEYTELIPDFDGPDGSMFSVMLLTYAAEDGEGDEHDISLTIDNATIEMPLNDFIALLAELKAIEPDLRNLAK
jgi:hypothetical protein